MTLPMTKLPGVPDKRSVNPGMAHYAATGPAGAFCGGCEYRTYLRDDRGRKTHGCWKFYELTGKHGPVVDAMWQACKYFERKTESE